MMGGVCRLYARCGQHRRFFHRIWEEEKRGPLVFESDRLHVENLKLDRPEVATAGELSRLVITDLLNDTMPLIRYDIGDIARAHEPMEIAVGTQAVAISELQGKAADVISPPHGRTVTTFQILGAIKDYLPDAQYRFVGITPDRYVLQYHPGARFSADNISRVMDALKELLGNDVDIAVQEVGTIGRESSGKLRPLVNLHNVSEVRRLELADELGIRPLLPMTERDAAVAIVRRGLTSVIPSYGNRSELPDDEELYGDLAIDSLRFVTLVLKLEDELSREINDEDLLDAELVTVGDLVTFVENLLRT
jgi:acyl carrier protein